jgi:hypothetical protein
MLKSKVRQFWAFLSRAEGPTAAESALFFCLVMLVCLLSLKATLQQL